MQVKNIFHALEFLQALTSYRLQLFFSKADSKQLSTPSINIETPADFLTDFIIKEQLSDDDIIVLLIAIAIHIQPNFFENIIRDYLPQGGDFPEFGGVKGSNYRGMLPTGETAQFIIAGDDLQKRMFIQNLLLNNSILVKKQIVYLEKTAEGEPVMSGKIILSKDYTELITTGRVSKLKFGADFPAKPVTTALAWNDMVLSKATLEHIENIRLWLQYNKQLLLETNMAKRIKPGYKALFYGASGTGKTLAATLLGKEFKMDVYRIDLSQVVSKYIGETEKNLEKVFNAAEHQNWILFFDEADALFSKRGNVQSAHDKYANQETAYLLQRVEDYPGLIVLASNYKNNMDNSFLRRFNSIIHFPLPTTTERLVLWKNALPEKLPVDFDIQDIAYRYELTGAAIVNVIHYAVLKTIAAKSNLIAQADILQGIKYEFQKEDKFIELGV